MSTATFTTKRRASHSDARRFAFAFSLSALLVLPALGCGNEAATDEMGEEVSPLAPPPVVEIPPAPPADRGPDGALLESSEMLVGILLPRGLTPVTSEERHHAFESSYPPELFVRYFGPRVTTGSVERRTDGGARYHEAVPRENVGIVPFDLLITTAAEGRTLVIFEQLQAPLATPRTQAEVEAAIQEVMEEASRPPAPAE